MSLRYTLKMEEKYLAILLYGVIAAIIVQKLKQYIANKKSPSNYTEQLRKNIDPITTKKKRTRKSRTSGKEDFETLLQNSPELSEEDKRKARQARQAVLKFSKYIKYFVLFIFLAQFLPVLKNFNKHEDQEKIKQKADLLKKELIRLKNIPRPNPRCRSNECAVRQIVWEDAQDCFKGKKIYDQTKCSVWACSPRGSGKPKTGKICKQGHAGIKTRYQLLDFNPSSRSAN